MLGPLCYSLCIKIVNGGGQALKKTHSTIQETITIHTVNVHYNHKRSLVLSCNASAYGIEAALSQVMDDGEEKPVALASRSLNQAEKKYSRIEKEGLAWILEVTKFHIHLCGRTFQLVADHKPLVTLFKERKAVPAQVAARVQRWALKLASYDYSIHFKPGV